MTVILQAMQFPTTYTYRGVDLTPRLKQLLRPAVDQWALDGLIRRVPSFGLASTGAMSYHDIRANWDDPTKLVGFTLGWGPDADQYIANAIRKMRPAARTGLDTIDICASQSDQYRDKVDSVSEDPDNRFPWGDFPHPGAAIIGSKAETCIVAVSALKGVEDDWIARMVGGFLRAEQRKVDEALAAMASR